MKKTRVTAAVVSALVALFSLAANVFAASPCVGPAYEPELPEKLREP